MAKVNPLLLVSFLGYVGAALALVGPHSTLGLTPSARLQRQLSPSRLQQSESSYDDNDDNEKSTLQRQRQDTQEALDRISALKSVLVMEDSDLLSLENYQRQVDQIEVQLQQLEYEVVPPKGLTMDEFQDAMILVLQSPYIVRRALCEALEVETPDKAAAELKQIPDIVTQLYQQRIQLTPQRLQDALKKAKSRKFTLSITGSPTGSMIDSMLSDTQSSPSSKGKSNSNSNLPKSIQDFFGDDDKTEEEIRLENTVKNVLGRVTRKEGREATKDNLDRVLKALDKETFVVAGTEKIPGGYVIRGRNVKPSAAALIEAVDSKLPEDFAAQVSLMEDVTDADIIDAEPVLVLLNKDFSPRAAGLVGALCSGIAIFTAFTYCVGVYGANELVTGQLSEATAIQDNSGISMFTNRVYDVMLPLLCIQVWHEIAHFAAAKLNKIDMGIPILLPFWSLPFMGSKTDLLSSPPNRSALFDFAIAGPLVGITSSLGCFALGLVLTGTADAAASQYFPTLPVSLITTSTLGGSMVDYFLGGGMVGMDNRFITMQDPSSPVVLHPAAIAGYCGLLINSLAMLPLGSTDGGRISLAIFGRFGQTLVGAITWVTLLIASFTLERPDILIAAWIVNNLVQTDQEIPCRDETEPISIPRVMAALSLWFVVLLTVIPLS